MYRHKAICFLAIRQTKAYMWLIKVSLQFVHNKSNNFQFVQTIIHEDEKIFQNKHCLQYHHSYSAYQISMIHNRMHVRYEFSCNHISFIIQYIYSFPKSYKIENKMDRFNVSHIHVYLTHFLQLSFLCKTRAGGLKINLFQRSFIWKPQKIKNEMDKLSVSPICR